MRSMAEAAPSLVEGAGVAGTKNDRLAESAFAVAGISSPFMPFRRLLDLESFAPVSAWTAG